MRVLATCARGTRALVERECSDLGLPVVHRDGEGVTLELDEVGLARALVHLRMPTRLLLRLGRFAARTADELYEGAAALPWSRWLTPDSTFAVHASGDLVPSSAGARGLDHHIFVALKTKDALCDQLVRRHGRRPNVAREDPDMRISVRGYRGQWAVDLDASGTPLHERGWRVAQGPAPLKETLAAAMVELVGWTGDGRLHDPMAGAGTLVVEAVNRALGIAPGCTRSFGIERWPLHGEAMTQHLDDARDRAVEHAQQVLAKPTLDVRAGDVEPASLRALRDNLVSAGLEHVVEVEQCDATELPVPPKGTTLLANPPYGERIGDDVEALYRRLGARWRSFAGTTAWLVDGHPGFTAAFDERPRESHGLWNGPLPVQWRRFGW